MRTTRSLARRGGGVALVLSVPFFAAAVVRTVAVCTGLEGRVALLWAAASLATHGLLFVGTLTTSAHRGFAAGASPARVEILTDRALTYYLVSGVMMAATARALTLLPIPFGPLGWPLAGMALLVTFRRHFYPGEDHLRGRRLLTYQECRARARSLLGSDDRGLPWGDLWVPTRLSVLHFLLVGAPGSGKTLTIRMLMSEFLSRMTNGAGKRAIVYDAKRDVVSILSGMKPEVPVRLLNPFDARSARWAIAKDAASPAVCMQIAETLIHAEEGPNQFFSLAGIEVVANLMVAFNLSAPGRWTLRDVILAIRDPRLLRTILARRAETHGPLVHFEEPRTLANILSTVRVRLAQLEPIAAAWDHASDEVSLDEWARGEMILVLGNDETSRVCLDALNRVILRRSVELVLNGPEVDDWRTLYVLDEVAKAGKLDSLGSLLAKGRSKGASAVLGFQDMDGLRAVYDKEADEIVGQCATKALFRLESPGTAEWASRLIGQTEQWEHQVTTAPAGDSTTHQRTKRDGVLPSEFLSLPPASRDGGFSGYFVVPTVGAFHRTLSPHSIGRLLREKGDDPDFVPRPISEQYLRPWTVDDFKRLGLPEPDAPTPPPEDDTGSGRRTLRVVKSRERSVE